MKKYLALLGGAMFFVVCVSLYLMLESTSMTTSYGYADNDINSIEAKIKAIELDLQRNHKTITMIKETVRDIANGDKTGLQRLQSVLNMAVAKSVAVVKMPTVNRTRLHLPSDVCALSEAPPSSTDVQMMDVFDMLPFDNPDGGTWKQGWEVKYDVHSFEKQKLKVFVVPHSHNDPGWLKTFERYYQDQTRPILDNMLDKLEAYPQMRFIFAEMSFFSLWWAEISTKKREKVKEFIQRGQLEIVTGGWVMCDEANAHYYAMLDQLIEGNLWLLENVGATARSGWAIDPFGQSPTMAYLLKGSSFDNMLIQRVHYTVKKYLAKTKQLEFLWRQNWDQHGQTDMFCHMMPFYSYDVPHTCGPDPQVCCQFDFKRLPGGRVTCPWKIPPQEIHDGNIASKAEILLDQYRKKAQLYKNNVVLIPLGDDFRYDKAVEWDQQYTNYQKLFNYMNAKQEWNVEAHFGTLSDYFDALHERAGVNSDTNLPNGYPVLSGDFFTYSDRDDHYWSGYYTSRPFYKRLDRVMESHLRAGEIIFSMAVAQARQLALWSFPEAMLMKSITNARRNLGLYQHHDGITGTAKDHVVVDYGSRLLQSINNMKRVMMDSAQFLLTAQQGNYVYDDGSFFDMDEIRANHDAMAEKTIITLNKAPKQIVFYNSLAHHRQAVVCIHVSDSNVAVKNSEGETIATQVSPYWMNGQDISAAKFKLYFLVFVSGLGLNTYTIQSVAEGTNPLNTPSTITLYNTLAKKSTVGPFSLSEGTTDDIELANSILKASVSQKSGSLNSVELIASKTVVNTEIKFLLYGTTNKKDKSGAYLFLPNGPAKPVQETNPIIRVVKGPIISQSESFLPNVLHTISVINSPAIEGHGIQIENIVDIREHYNKELTMRIISGVKNVKREWFSDLNGFQIQRRQTLDKLPLQGNFYPMPTMSFLQDNTIRMSLLSGQSLGVASLEQGWLEVVQDRRLNQDDNRGLTQGVTDNKKTPNIFTLLVEARDGLAAKSGTHYAGYPSLMSQLTSLELIHPVYVLPKHNTYGTSLAANMQPLAEPLPCDTHLLNLRTMQTPTVGSKTPELNTAVFYHRLAVDCSVPVTGLVCPAQFGKINLDRFLTGFLWKNVQEVSFNLIHKKTEINTKEDISLSPMEIRVFKGQMH